ncbi:MAG: hypothetical protein ACRENO_00990 [Thermodesulfobacteriota bacterium]
MKRKFENLFIVFGIALYLIILLFPVYWFVFGGGRYHFFLNYASRVLVKYDFLNEKAENYANEMLQTAENNPRDWN